MVYCVVKNCDSNQQKNNTKIRFFRFPNDENRRQIWINACGNPYVNHKTGTICSVHFTEEDWRLKDRLLNLPLKKRMLNKNAVPTKDIFCSEMRKQRTARCCKRDAKKIVQEVLKESNQRVTENVEIANDITCLENIEVEVRKSVEVQTEMDIECAREMKIMELEKALKSANKEIKLLKEKNDQLSKLESSVSKILTKGQIEKLKNPDKKINWTLDDISAATCLHSSGPRAYRFLYAKHFPLPGTSTLRHWAAKLNVRAGILHDVLNLMKAHSMSELDKVTVLAFDEMKIRSEYEYDKGNDEVLKPTNYVQVVIARGLFANWKQPVFFDYDCKMTASILNDIIECLDAVGFCVVAIVSDMGPTNQGLWRKLEITTTHTFFPHPKIPGNQVFVFADVPHLLKLFRNHFIDTGFILNGKFINKQPLHELLQATNNTASDLNIAFKLTHEHLNVKNADRQKVKTAAQVFSHTVSEAIRRCVSLGRLDARNSIECADLIKAVNDWFDVFNTRTPAADSRE